MNRVNGKAFTLHHYTKTLSAKEKAFNHSFQLPEYFSPLIGDKKKVFIADLGAGMFSTTGSTWPGVEVCLCPSDELANEYMDILRKYEIKPKFFIDQQNMEELTYLDNYFDIVHCVNALDHVEDPFQAIKEMYRICKPGGWIYLRHHFNTAKIQKNRGLHNWNMTISVDHDCIFYGKLGGFSLHQCVPGFINTSKKEAGEKFHQIVSILHKV